jgi:hypothetical protein
MRWRRRARGQGQAAQGRLCWAAAAAAAGRRRRRRRMTTSCMRRMTWCVLRLSVS